MIYNVSDRAIIKSPNSVGPLSDISNILNMLS